MQSMAHAPTLRGFVSVLGLAALAGFSSTASAQGWVVGIGNGTVRILDYNWNGRAGQVTDHWVTIPSGTRFVYSDR